MVYEVRCIKFWRIFDEVKKELPTMKHSNVQWLVERLVENETLDGAYSRIVLKESVY